MTDKLIADAGYALVPLEPTEKICKDLWHDLPREACAYWWKNMLKNLAMENTAGDGT